MPAFDERPLDTNFRIELKRIYLEESDTKVAQLKEGMRGYLRAPDDEERVAHFIEIAHKLAGAGATYGFPVISDLGRALEALLKAVRVRSVSLTDEARNAVARACRAVEEVFARAKEGHETKSDEFPVIRELFALAEASPDPGTGTLAEEEKRRVVVVDDDADSLRIVNLALVKAGYHVQSYVTAEEALEGLRSERPDLLILDVMLPDMDGYELCRRIRADRTFAFTPVLFVTTRGHLDDKLAGFQTGGDDYVTKPFEPEELVARVGAHLARIELLKELSVKDALTQTFNHRYFQEQLAVELGRARRYSRGLSVAMIDIDNFRAINDSYGHHVGDILLRRVAELLHTCVRNVDVVCRYGGEEFMVIMPETPAGKALEVINRIRENIARKPLQLHSDEGDREIRVTVSAGIASYPVDAQAKDELITKSEKAMETAKKKGRNLVCIALDIEV